MPPSLPDPTRQHGIVGALPRLTEGEVVPPAVSTNRRERRRLGRWGLATLAALLVLGGSWASMRGPKVPAVVVTRQPLVQKVVATGRVEPPARVNVGSAVLATVVRVNVDEGETVQAGQVLVELDPAEAEAAASQAEAALRASAARLDQLRGVTSRVAAESVLQAEISLEQAEREAARQQTLAEAGSGSRQALDQANKALALARSQRAAAMAQASASGPGGAELRVALATHAQAEAALAGARARLAQLRLTARVDGVVLTREVEPGDIVQPGRTLLVLARRGATIIEAQPDEKSLAFLAAGQKARISADAFPQESFAAEVATIAPSIDPTRGTVVVKLRIPEPPRYLREGMTVSVDIEIARRESALVLESEAVRGDVRDPFVLTVADGKVARKPVQLGLRGEGSVEVLDGLSAGETVLLPGARELKPGQAVRAARRP